MHMRSNRVASNFRKTMAEFFDPNATQLQTACSMAACRPGLGNVVEITVGVRDVDVEGGRKFAGLHRQ